MLNQAYLENCHCVQVDTIDPVAGVTVREAGRTVTGPSSPHKALALHSTTQSSTLAPIQQLNTQLNTAASILCE